MAGARKVAVTKYQFWHARSPRERILEIHYKVRLLQQKEGFWVDIIADPPLLGPRVKASKIKGGLFEKKNRKLFETF